MCGLYGFVNYSGEKMKNLADLTNSLSEESAIRGTDATGIAFCNSSGISVLKESKSAYRLDFKHSDEIYSLTGHTRHSTQGSEKHNYNNHPFSGKCKNTRFALSHNGVLSNDRTLRKELNLPKTKIETDSYIAVQLIEAAGELSFASLRNMAEPLRGSFTFTVLSPKDELYFVKGDNPMCIYHYPNLGVYLYASTEEILKAALRKLPFRLGRPDRIDIFCGQILCIDAEGHISRSSFDDRNLYNRLYAPWYSWEPQNTEDSYIEDLKSVAAFFGYTPDDVDFLLQQGYTTDDIEELLYCG